MNATKAELHEIVDRLCDEYAEDVLVLVRSYLAEEETLTPEEEAEVEQGLAEIAAGHVISREELRRKYSLA